MRVLTTSWEMEMYRDSGYLSTLISEEEGEDNNGTLYRSFLNASEYVAHTFHCIYYLALIHANETECFEVQLF